MTPQNEALRLLEEALRELESQKGSVLSAVQKLSRAAGLLSHQDIQHWCAIQLGEQKYVLPLSKLLAALVADTESKSNATKAQVDAAVKDVDQLGLKHEIHYTNEELNVKFPESGGGYINIGFIEERYADLVRTRRGNDRTYYKNQLNNHLNYVRKKAHEFATALFNQLKFAGTVRSCFDVLKEAVDDRMLDINPSLAEQLMLAFKRISSDKEEEWSQALTTCRRLLEDLADELYPASIELTKGRSLGQGQYVNRIWAFMDNSIKSETNRELAKTHVDFLGAWLEKINKITHKGVHAAVNQQEAVKAVFHTYLMISDVVEYLGHRPQPKATPDINTATIDEIEALLGVNRTVAKEVIKARVKHQGLDRNNLAKVAGIGAKTLEKAIAAFDLK